MSTTGPLPPRARLARVVRSLCATLPGQMGDLLDASRFAQGKEALLRLATAADQAAREMSVEEAAWMADRLLDGWASIADPVLEPAVAIAAPEEVWLGAEPVRVPLRLVTAGLEEVAEVLWEGPSIEDASGGTAVLAAAPPEGGAGMTATARARVRGRREGGARCVLVAEVRVRLRRPEMVVSDDGRRAVVRDQAGDPAVGVEVEIGGERFVTGVGGSIAVDRPLPADAPVIIAGVAAGRWRA